MSAEAVEFSPPAGVHPHEAPFFLGGEDWIARSLYAAMLELVSSGALVAKPDAAGHLVWQAGASVGHDSTPLLDRIAERLIAQSGRQAAGPIVTGGGIEASQAEALIKRRLTERGWYDKTTGALTAEGQAVAGQLNGYRNYLKEAMIDPVHEAGASGEIDAETCFSAAFGLMNFANVARALATHAGVLAPGQDEFWLSFLGGKASEQNEISIRNPSQRLRGCVLIVILLFLAFWLGTAWLAAQHVSDHAANPVGLPHRFR